MSVHATEARYARLIHQGYRDDPSAPFPAGTRVVCLGHDTGTVEAALKRDVTQVVIVALDDGTSMVYRTKHTRAVS